MLILCVQWLGRLDVSCKPDPVSAFSFGYFPALSIFLHVAISYIPNSARRGLLRNLISPGLSEICTSSQQVHHC